MHPWPPCDTGQLRTIDALMIYIYPAPKETLAWNWSRANGRSFRTCSSTLATGDLNSSFPRSSSTCSTLRKAHDREDNYLQHDTTVYECKSQEFVEKVCYKSWVVYCMIQCIRLVEFVHGEVFDHFKRQTHWDRTIYKRKSQGIVAKYWYSPETKCYRSWLSHNWIW